MPYLKPERPEKVSAPSLRASKERGERLVCITAYDYPTARIVDEAGIDIILVGDSLGNVVLGYGNTVPVTLDEILIHVKAVRRGVERALLVADMPYGSFHTGADEAVANALRFVKEGGAQAVKIEGARPEIIAALVGAEVPVMAHLGLTPQSVHKLGGFKVQGRGAEARAEVLAAAAALEEAGAFSLVLECVPASLAAEVSERLHIPTIGIGAGAGCDGQVLVYHDLLGLEQRIAPRFVRRYAEQGQEARAAIGRFADDVRTGRFPSPAESFEDPTAAPQAGKLYG